MLKTWFKILRVKLYRNDLKETKITSHKWEVQVIDVLRVKLQEIYAGNSEEIDFG